MSRIMVMGDIHGNYKALLQVLERSNFDYENDTLIQLGDICDGWSQVYECVEELIKIRNLILILGNHDEWFIQYLDTGKHPTEWLQGGDGTLRSYANHINHNPDIIDKRIMIYPGYGKYLTNLTVEDIPDSHIEFFKNQRPYYIDSNNRCFVHGGFDREYKIEDQHYITLCWDRELWNKALYAEFWGQTKIMSTNDFDEIYIGHTTTQGWDKIIPMKAANVWNLDTGAGWSGKLSIMDVDTKEFWQSDLCEELYLDEVGRGKFKKRKY